MSATSTQEAQAAHRAQSERVALDKIAERLATQFPELPAEAITSAIQGRYSAFDDSSIRDFVPVLVEHSVREKLAASLA